MKDFHSGVFYVVQSISQCVANNSYLSLCTNLLNFLLTWQKVDFSEELITVKKEERNGQEACETVKEVEQKQQVSSANWAF